MNWKPIAALLAVLVLAAALAALTWKPSPRSRAGAVVYVPATALPTAHAARPRPPKAGAPIRPRRPAPAATLRPVPAPPPVQASAVPMATLRPGSALPHRVAISNPNARPEILAMSLSSPVAYGGEVVSGTVETSSNVASVVATIAGYSSSLSKVGPGRFALSYRVPKLPFFLHHTYTIEVTARNARGDAVSSSIPITVR